MNWTLILFGNLIMDSTIALFAILTSLEAHYLSISNEKYRAREFIDEAGKIYQKQFEDSPVLKSMLEDGDEVSRHLKQTIKSFWDMSDKHLMEAGENGSKADYFSPFTIKKIVPISFLFIIGIILQIVGILSY